jgi:hypothetical protein
VVGGVHGLLRVIGTTDHVQQTKKGPSANNRRAFPVHGVWFLSQGTPNLSAVAFRL